MPGECFPRRYDTILALRKVKKNSLTVVCSMISQCQSHKINRNVDVEVSYICPKSRCSTGQIELCMLCEQAYYKVLFYLILFFFWAYFLHIIFFCRVLLLVLYK